jgi:hypothetical protein
MNCTIAVRTRKVSRVPVVHDQVQIALAIAALHVGQAMELLGQRTQRLGQQTQRITAHRQLAGLGLEHLTLDADDVAEIQLALELIVGLRPT